MESNIIKSLGIEWNPEDLKRFTGERPRAYLRNMRASTEKNPVKVIIEEGPYGNDYPWWSRDFNWFRGEIYSIPKNTTRILFYDEKLIDGYNLDLVMKYSEGKLKQIIPKETKVIIKKLNYESYREIGESHRPKIIKRNGQEELEIGETSLRETFSIVRPRFLMTKDGRIFYNVEALFDENDRFSGPPDPSDPLSAGNENWNYEKGKHLEHTLGHLIKLSQNFKSYYHALSE